MLLAAGQSKRFGSNKLLYPYGGTALLERSAAAVIVAAKMSGQSALAVVAPDQPVAGQLLAALGFDVVVNANADEGIGSSIAVAAAVIPSGSVIICLADMPNVSAAHIQLVASKTTSSDTVVISDFEGQLAPPSGFGEAYLPVLRALTGDQGARAVINMASAIHVVGERTMGVDVDCLADI